MGKPKIRFKGYTEDWEQRKCKEIFDKVGKPVNIKEGELYREIGIRSHGKGLFYKDEINGYELGNKRVFWIEPDCFIVNVVFAWERAVARTTKNEIGMIASHRFPMYKPKIKIVDLDYITKFFTTNKGKYILEMASPGGAGRNKTMGQKEFADSIISLPSYDEQKKIGRSIECLDNLITLHQRKCDETKKLKKCMLQKMFPKDGEKVPEIRFSGFTGDWKQRKVVEIAPLQRGFDLPNASIKLGKYPVVMSNGIGGYHSEYKVHAPGVVTGRSGTIGKLHYIESDFWPHNTTLWVTDFKGNNQKFIYYLYQKLDLKRFGTGSGVPTLNRNDVHDTIISVPVYQEQEKISSYLKMLDDLITFHQQKCDELKNIKKFMLQNMFVSENKQNI